MRELICLFSMLLTTAAWCPTLAQDAGKPGTEPAARHTRSCTVNDSQPTPADMLLASENFVEAETSYRTEIAATPASGDAHLGVVRALIGQNKLKEADSEATAFLSATAQSATAQVAASEVAFREANLDEAFQHAKNALQKDNCDARARAALADLYEVTALFGQASQLYASAHRIRPADELIRRSWMDSLPRKERQQELANYLEGEHHVSADDALGLSQELQHLKAYKAGECRVTSKASAASADMQPVFGDNRRPEAYGLDVFFNGKQRRRMQIDTGASGIVLTEGAARALSLTPEYEIKTGGVGDEGDRKSFLSHVASMQIGNIEVTNCMVEVVSKAKLDIDGLIGMDVFRNWLVTLDYQDAKLHLTPLPPRPAKEKLESDSLPSDIGDETSAPQDRFVAPAMKDWTATVRIGHQILLPARLKKDSPIRYVLMDTGASSTLLSSSFGKEAGKLHGTSVELRGISGKVDKVYETSRTALIVDRFILPPEEFLATDLTKLSHNTGMEVSGLFGLSTLQRLTIQIDYRDNLLKLSYDPRRDILHF